MELRFQVPTLKVPLPYGRSISLSYALRTVCFGYFPRLEMGRVFNCYAVTIGLTQWLLIRTKYFPNGELESKAWGLRLVAGESPR